jgi:hypothetical protein
MFMSDDEFLEDYLAKAEKFKQYLNQNFPNEFVEGEHLFDTATRLLEKLQGEKLINGVTISSLLQSNQDKENLLRKHNVSVNPNSGVPNATDFLERRG